MRGLNMAQQLQGFEEAVVGGVPRKLASFAVLGPCRLGENQRELTREAYALNSIRYY